MIYCKNCGSGIPDGAAVCPGCGTPVPSVPVPARNPAYSQQPYYPQEPAYPPNPPYPQEPPYPPPQHPYPPNAYQHNQFPYRGQAPVNSGVTVIGIFTRALALLSTKPFLLWGLSLMFNLLTCLAVVFCVLPIISMPIVFALSVGMKAIFLDGIREKEVTSDQLFAGFKNFFRSVGCVAWMALWLLIWSMVPFAGFIMVIIKFYSYRFAPYIMIEDSGISATAALRRSKELTRGMKGKMFLADLLVFGLLSVVYLVLLLFSQIPVVGVVFIIAMAVFSIIVGALCPLLYGLIEAAFYDEAPKGY